jgi:hypothetical protein
VPDKRMVPAVGDNAKPKLEDLERADPAPMIT